MIYDAVTEVKGEDNEAKSAAEIGIRNVDGVLMVAVDNKFNGTNPDIRIVTNTSEDFAKLAQSWADIWNIFLSGLISINSKYE